MKGSAAIRQWRAAYLDKRPGMAQWSMEDLFQEV